MHICLSVCACFSLDRQLAALVLEEKSEGVAHSAAERKLLSFLGEFTDGVARCCVSVQRWPS